jgi:hypothetical protein
MSIDFTLNTHILLPSLLSVTAVVQLFVNILKQLAQGYVDLLKLFIVSVKSAYQSTNITTLSSMKDIVQMVNECPTNTAGRPLELEEIQLRTSWIYAVALMLDHIEYRKVATPKNSNIQSHAYELDEIATNVKSTYGPVLPAIISLQNSGGSLRTQDFIQENKALLPGSIFDDDIQFVIASQTIKVLWYTLIVLEEERKANDMDNVARPQIPREEGIN